MTPFPRRQFLARSARLAGGLAVAGTGFSALAGCGDDDESSGSSPASTAGGGLRQVSFQASWVNDAEFMGYFIAIENGYFADEGLEVEHKPGGPDVIPEALLLTGDSLIALTTPDTTVKAITDEGAPFKIIGAQFQKNPLGVVSLRESGISSPADLVGKTLAVPTVNVLSVEAMFQISGIDPSDVNVVPYQYDPTPLLSGEVDASVDFVPNVPFVIEQLGGDPVSFLLYDFGFTIFNDTVVVTEETLANEFDTLVSWMRAARHGWDENFVDPDAYPAQFADTWFEGTGRTVENELFYNNATETLMSAPGGIFSMSAEAIESNVSALQAIGLDATPDMFDTSVLDAL